MVYIFGTRTARIARFADTGHICYRCNAYDREIRVYQPYFHLCFIPVFPIGPRQFEVHCRNCGDDTRLESIVKKYERKARTPFYMYSALILAVSLAAFWFYWNKNTQTQKMEAVARPAVGDVYTLTEKDHLGTHYYFVRVVALDGDSVNTLQSHLEYLGFVSNLADDDYFVKEDTVSYTRKKLKEMLDDDEIYSVKRGYGEGSGFNRIK
jgi:hypothetical protein